MKHQHERTAWEYGDTTKKSRRDSRQVLRAADGSSADQLMGRSTVLVAEDDADMRSMISGELRRSGYEVIEVGNGDDLLRAIETGVVSGESVQPDLVVSDIKMPGPSGLEVLLALRTSDWAMPVILITAFGDEATHAEALRLGAFKVLDKPFELDDLRHAVGSLVPPTV